MTKLAHSSFPVAAAHTVTARTSISAHGRRHRIIDRRYSIESVIAHLLTLLMSIAPKFLAMHVITSIFVVLVVVVRVFLIIEAIASWAEVVVVR